eukprot:gnl/TRDRNA2_/TRDRNA2_173478_c0_seq3.p1 gnl/TRDRNA2_/TRDRNA2_173478_c0~~gnl/TRDRNA2_/TRDRNA2_173478_c0_seq3.p1  ORF type:complete len:365 (-),score=28.35 gnl/TRDRNA2_/TRDRNA2_173478_c0_seq3:158-1252(-)
MVCVCLRTHLWLYALLTECGALRLNKQAAVEHGRTNQSDSIASLTSSEQRHDDVSSVLMVRNASYDAVSGVLMVGCSTIEAQYKIAHTYFEHENITLTTTAGLTCFPESYPSFWRAEQVLAELKFNGKLKLQIDMQQNSNRQFHIVYLNFAANHLLHIHPSYPWTYRQKGHVPSPDLKPRCRIERHSQLNLQHNISNWLFDYGRDYNGFIELEQWMHDDIAAYKAIAKHVVIMTPNYVCEDRYSGEWYSSTHGSRENETLACIESLKVNQNAHGFWPRQQDASTNCRQGWFTADGARHLRDRMIRVARKEGVPIVDAFKITEKKCSRTKDGVHYDEALVTKMIKELRRVTGNLEHKPHKIITTA